MARSSTPLTSSDLAPRSLWQLAELDWVVAGPAVMCLGLGRKVVAAVSLCVAQLVPAVPPTLTVVAPPDEVVVNTWVLLGD